MKALHFFFWEIVIPNKKWIFYEFPKTFHILKPKSFWHLDIDVSPNLTGGPLIFRFLQLLDWQIDSGVSRHYRNPDHQLYNTNYLEPNMTSIFEGYSNPPKQGQFPIKTRVIWLLGIYNCCFVWRSGWISNRDVFFKKPMVLTPLILSNHRIIQSIYSYCPFFPKGPLYFFWYVQISQDI